MELTFNQIEAVFAARFDIPADRAAAFRGRLQHLQRLNFPTGVNTGRGKKAAYGWTQLIQLMVALDLIDLGMTPDVAAKSVMRSTASLIRAIYAVASKFESADALGKAFKRARCPFGKTQIAVASAYALTFPEAAVEGQALIIVRAGTEFTQSLIDDPEVEPAAAYINLGARMMVVSQLVGRIASIEPTELAEDLLRWSCHWADEDALS